MKPEYDVLIAGSGPIGAATAYFLTKTTQLKVALVSEEPGDETHAAYTQAGGSLRWQWSDEQKSDMTRETADFIKQLNSDGVDVSLIEDSYAYLYTGQYHPSINFSGKQVVHHLLREAMRGGLTFIRDAKVTAIKSTEDGVTVKAGDQTLTAAKALLALGVANPKFMPDYELEREKRQLFVLDLKVEDSEQVFPHTIARLGDDGYAYVFVKQTPNGLRFVVGQEDIIKDDEDGANDYFAALLEAGVGDIFPFLRDAKVETLWHGWDSGNKDLKFEQSGSIWAANCGSAARGCAWIGRTLAEKLAS